MGRLSRTKSETAKRGRFRGFGRRPRDRGVLYTSAETESHRDATLNASSSPTVKGRFSEELRDLSERFAERPVQLSEILDATRGRGMDLLLVFITLPFLTPIPLPGFSIPFGLVVAIIGARMALGQKPWLPQRLLRRELPARLLPRLLKAGSRIVKWLEWFLRPRLTIMNDGTVFRRLAAALIAISGLFLIIPLPVPFSNSLPACTVLLLASGALERDGLAFLAGCGMFVVTTTFFLLLALGGAEVTQIFRRLLTNE